MSDGLYEADNLAGDINVLVSGFTEVPIQLIEKLVIYIVNRDHKVFDHAYKLGKEAGNAEQHKRHSSHG